MGEELSEDRLLRAQEGLEQTLGPTHLATINCRIRLGDFYYDKARFLKAEPHFLAALEVYEREFGENHLNTANVLLRLALLYHGQENYEKAEPYYKRTIKVKQDELGDFAPEVIDVLKNYATLLQMTDRETEAQQLLSFAQEHLSGRWKRIVP